MTYRPSPPFRWFLSTLALLAFWCTLGVLAIRAIQMDRPTPAAMEAAAQLRESMTGERQ